MFSNFKTPSREKEKLKFPLNQFNIFTEGDEDGVVLKIKTSYHKVHKWSNKYRTFEPAIGDLVGLLTHHFFAVYQIYAIGIIVSKRGSEIKPKYDVFIIDYDPLEWKQIANINYLGSRETKISIGLVKNLNAQTVVTLNCDPKQFELALKPHQSEINKLTKESTNLIDDESDYSTTSSEDESFLF
jgi:hypothetical protein